MRFEYLYSLQAMDAIDIDNLGEACLIGADGLNREYYLIIHTIEGESHIITYGPVYVDLDELPAKVGYNYEKIPYNSNKLHKIIDRWLNGSNAICQVQESTMEEIRFKVKDMVKYVAER